MNVPAQLVILTLPSLIYIGVRRSRGESQREILAKLGWRGCLLKYFCWGLVALIPLTGVIWLASQLVPRSAFEQSNLSTSYYATWRRSTASFLLAWLREAFYVALGEEIFFRGLVGGWVVRRFGFAVGNSVQTFIFLLPHLLLLLVNPCLWPFLAVQLTAGWFLGWLRYHSSSILPGWLSHSLANASGALLAMT
jgi:uncharacterized protein